MYWLFIEHNHEMHSRPAEGNSMQNVGGKLLRGYTNQRSKSKEKHRNWHWAYVPISDQVMLKAAPSFLNVFYRLVASIMQEGRQQGESHTGNKH